MKSDNRNSSKKGTKRVPFPKRLFNLLKLAEENGWEDIISWVDDGKGFKVHDRKQFETVMLAKYFNTTRYASFTRQLHAYDFDCVRTGRHTGIYSHPNFTRDNPEASCSLQREASKVNSKQAISDASKKKNKVQIANLQQGIRAGDTIVQFPSILMPSIINDESSLSSTTDIGSSDESSMMNGLYRNVLSQVADQTRRTLIRIPPKAPDNPLNSPNNAFWSLSANRIQTISDGATSPVTVDGEQRQQQQLRDHQSPKTNSMLNTNMNNQSNGLWSTLGDDDFDSVPLALGDDDDVLQFDDLEPIPWSPEHSSPTDEGQGLTVDHPNQSLDAILEPRPIETMVENPSTTNDWWYDSAPMFGTPRKRAMLEFSLPISLPLGFYLLDVSKFGLCWVIFLVSGHFVECLFTAWGGAKDKHDKTYTKDLCIQPILGMLQHHIMDLLWFHYLLSNMMLTPEYFGQPCFPLLYLFLWPQPINLAIVIKTHYCESNLEGTYTHEKYWIGDLIKKSILGYALTILGIAIMDVFDMYYIRVPLVFGFNMIPLVVFESYRCMLSLSAVNGALPVVDKAVEDDESKSENEHKAKRQPGPLLGMGKEIVAAAFSTVGLVAIDAADFFFNTLLFPTAAIGGKVKKKNAK